MMHEISSSVSDEKLVCQQLQSDPRRVKVAAENARNMPDALLIESRGPVVLVALNRPEKLNAVSNGLISGLMSALDRIELDRSARAIVITGAGRAFSAGAGISEFQPHIKEDPSEAVARFMRFQLSIGAWMLRLMRALR
jgi:enoyl-CoA hydratase/carnithine racemase